jgi:hypothetical protein
MLATERRVQLCCIVVRPFQPTSTRWSLCAAGVRVPFDATKPPRAARGAQARAVRAHASAAACKRSDAVSANGYSYAIKRARMSELLPREQQRRVGTELRHPIPAAQADAATGHWLHGNGTSRVQRRHVGGRGSRRSRLHSGWRAAGRAKLTLAIARTTTCRCCAWIHSRACGCRRRARQRGGSAKETPQARLRFGGRFSVLFPLNMTAAHPMLLYARAQPIASLFFLQFLLAHIIQRNLGATATFPHPRECAVRVLRRQRSDGGGSLGGLLGRLRGLRRLRRSHSHAPPRTQHTSYAWHSALELRGAAAGRVARVWHQVG